MPVACTSTSGRGQGKLKDELRLGHHCRRIFARRLGPLFTWACILTPTIPALVVGCSAPTVRTATSTNLGSDDDDDDDDEEEGIDDEVLATVLVIVLGIITILFNAGHYAYSSAEQRDQDLYIMTTFGASIRFSVQRAITAD